MKKIGWSNFLSLILDIIKIYGINFMICNGQETVFHFPKVGDFEEWGAVIYNFKMFLVAIFFKKDVLVLLACTLFLSKSGLFLKPARFRITVTISPIGLSPLR